MIGTNIVTPEDLVNILEATKSAKGETTVQEVYLSSFGKPTIVFNDTMNSQTSTR